MACCMSWSPAGYRESQVFRRPNLHPARIRAWVGRLPSRTQFRTDLCCRDGTPVANVWHPQYGPSVHCWKGERGTSFRGHLSVAVRGRCGQDRRRTFPRPSQAVMTRLFRCSAFCQKYVTGSGAVPSALPSVCLIVEDAKCETGVTADPREKCRLPVSRMGPNTMGGRSSPTCGVAVQRGRRGWQQRRGDCPQGLMAVSKVKDGFRRRCGRDGERRVGLARG